MGEQSSSEMNHRDELNNDEENDELVAGEKLDKLEGKKDKEEKDNEDQIVVLDMDEALDTETEMDKLVEEALRSAGKKTKSQRFRDDILKLTEEKVKLAADKDKLYAELYGVKTKLQKAKEEQKKTLEHLQRLQAEFSNYRKRIEREKEEWHSDAHAVIVKEILPILDNFDRAIQSFSTENPEEYNKGIIMIFNELRNKLESYGLEVMDADNKEFDPNFHEAVMREERDDVPNNTITEVFQKGFLFKDKTLRPAMVKVAIHPSEIQSERERLEDIERDEAAAISNDSPESRAKDVGEDTGKRDTGPEGEESDGEE